MSLSAFTGGRAPLYIKASDLLQAMHTMPSIPPEKREAARLACLAEEARLVAVAAPEAEAPAPDLAEPQVRFLHAHFQRCMGAQLCICGFANSLCHKRNKMGRVLQQARLTGLIPAGLGGMILSCGSLVGLVHSKSGCSKK